MSNYLVINIKKNFGIVAMTSSKHYFFHGGGPYHIETSPLICRANQWTGFYMIETSVVKD